VVVVGFFFWVEERFELCECFGVEIDVDVDKTSDE
jgi:hypothetical protein